MQEFDVHRKTGPAARTRGAIQLRVLLHERAGQRGELGRDGRDRPTRLIRAIANTRRTLVNCSALDV